MLRIEVNKEKEIKFKCEMCDKHVSGEEFFILAGRVAISTCFECAKELSEKISQEVKKI